MPTDSILMAPKPVHHRMGHEKLSSEQLPRFEPNKRRFQEYYEAETQDIIIEKLEDFSQGYPRLAAFSSSESIFSLYRGFSYLHSRVLFDLQANIVNLEKELYELDQFDEFDNEKRLRCQEVDTRVRRNSGRPREELLRDIRAHLKEYGRPLRPGEENGITCVSANVTSSVDDVLFKAQKLAAFRKPTSRDYKSVLTWCFNHKPLVIKEQEYLKHKEDIVTLHNGREYGWFDYFIESILIRFNSRVIRRLFCTPELLKKTSDKHVQYFSSHRIQKLVGIIITTIIFTLLAIPVVAMNCLTGIRRHPEDFLRLRIMGVLISFTLLFSMAMSLLTKAQRHELFAASAAYCAVLVVFFGNFTPTMT